MRHGHVPVTVPHVAAPHQRPARRDGQLEHEPGLAHALCTAPGGANVALAKARPGAAAARAQPDAGESPNVAARA